MNNNGLDQSEQHEAVDAVLAHQLQRDETERQQQVEQNRIETELAEHDRMMQEKGISKLWSDVSRLRRNDQSFTCWACELPSFYEPNLFRCLSQALARSSHLEELHLKSKWVLLDSVATELSQGIGNAKALKTLVLRGSVHETLEQNHWQVVYRGLRDSQSLERLVLWELPIHIEANDVWILPKSLRQLDLAANITSPHGFCSLSKAACHSNLETLNLYFRADQTNQDDLTRACYNFGLILDVMKNCKSVSNIKLCCTNGFEFKIECFLWDAFFAPDSSASLEVCCGCEPFVLGQSTPPPPSSERRLKLQRCLLEDEHIAYLVMIWPTTSTLTTLSLSSNRIGPEGTRLLLGATRHRSALRELDLSNNPKMGYEALRMIGEDLPNQPYLTKIYLYGCANVHERHDKAQESARQRASISLLEGVKQNVRLKRLIVPRGLFSSHTEDDELNFYLELNKHGRYLLSTERNSLASSVWYVILARCQRQGQFGNSMTYFFLREQPDLVGYGSKNPSRKRRLPK